MHLSTNSMKPITVCKTVIAVLATTALAHAQSGLPSGTSFYNEELRQKHLTEVQAAESQLEQETQQRIMNGDELITPQYDLRWLQNMTLDFKVAFASKLADTSLLKERLRVLVSTNCSQSWNQLYIRQGAQLVSAGQISTPFFPGNDPNLWRSFSLNLSSAYAQSHVMFKLEFTGGDYGNHFYLDDINITG
jgi:hypothetical protein